MAKRAPVTKKARKKVIQVREHLLTVPTSKKNPTGKTIRDSHPRRLVGTYLDLNEINAVFKKYDRKKIIYPTPKKLKSEYPNSDQFDDLIAVWTDYFNKKMNTQFPIDPDVIKALIASESSFDPDPLGNRKIARGLTQITKATFKILQDPSGEAKDFIFKGIRQKDLADPNISIPMAIRWLHRKRETAASKLKRSPSHEEIILDYKGLLKSQSVYKNNAITKYRDMYAKLKK